MTTKYNYLSRNIHPSSDILIRRARGVKLWDTNGKEYIDFSSQTLNLSLGNSTPIIKRAFLDQYKKFTFLSTRFINQTFLDLSMSLVQLAPRGLTKINIKLTNGGDANESAFKRARVYRKKPYILSFYYSHLGEGSETLKANGKHFSPAFMGGSNHFIHIIPPFFNGKTDEQVLWEIEYIFAIRDDVAAIIIEPIMVNAGVYIFSRKFMTELRYLCDKYEVTLIFDEIQTAFGWLGKLFAADYYNVTPDILTIGKAFALGFPLAGILMKKEYDVLDYGYDEYTYGGHAVSCAIALENVKHVTTPVVLEKIGRTIDKFHVLLQRYQSLNTNIVTAVRFCGLFAGIEFNSNRIASHIYDELIAHGLITRKSVDGSGPSLVLKPAINVSDLVMQKAMKILHTVTRSH